MAYLLGFDYGGTKVDIGLGTRDGEIVHQERLLVANYPTLGALIDASLESGRKMAAHDAVSAVGVSTMGITFADHVELAPNVSGWSDLHLPEQFRRVFGSIPVAFENDVRSACLAEMTWGSLRGVDFGAYLNLGSGIAMALVVDGRLHAGAHRAAGEIAYLWRSGEAGFSSGRAPFEEEFGGLGIDRTICRTFPPLKSLHDLFADLDRPQHRALFEAEFREIARRVGHVLLAVDVERVSVGGGIARRFEAFAPLFRDEWQSHLPYPPNLVASRFLDRAGLHGALALAAQS